MSWFSFTILAVVSRALYSIATKVLSKGTRVSAATQSLLLTLVAGVLSLFLSPFLDGISFTALPDHLLGVTLMITAQAFGNIFFFMGIKKLDAGTTQIAFSTILVWGVILSISFLGSTFSLAQLSGTLLMLTAILLLQWTKGRLSVNKEFVYIILSAGFFSVFQVASASLSEYFSTATYLSIGFFGPSIIVAVVYMNQIKKDITLLRKQINHTFLRTFFASGTGVLYYVFSFIAYKQAPDRGVVVVLLTSQVVLSVIFGILFLRETDNVRRKLIAGVLAFVAGVLIKS